jgi:hypothetical protein
MIVNLGALVVQIGLIDETFIDDMRALIRKTVKNSLDTSVYSVGRRDC